MNIITRKEAKNLCLKRYFTGKQCKHGHLCERQVLDGICVECTKEKSKIYYNNNRKKCIERHLKWKENNPEYHNIYNKKWVSENPDYGKEYYHVNSEKQKTIKRIWNSNNKEHKKEYNKRWNKENPNHHNNYHKNRRLSDTQYKITCNLRSRACKFIKGNIKSGSAVSDLGCSIEDLKLHLESLFTPEMSWENYGSYWHIDHIKPLSKFDLTDREQFLEACNYMNLQPLFWRDNIIKGNKIG